MIIDMHGRPLGEPRPTKQQYKTRLDAAIRDSQETAAYYERAIQATAMRALKRHAAARLDAAQAKAARLTKEVDCG